MTNAERWHALCSKAKLTGKTVDASQLLDLWAAVFTNIPVGKSYLSDYTYLPDAKDKDAVVPRTNTQKEYGTPAVFVDMGNGKYRVLPKMLVFGTGRGRGASRVNRTPAAATERLKASGIDIAELLK